MASYSSKQGGVDRCRSKRSRFLSTVIAAFGADHWLDGKEGRLCQMNDPDVARAGKLGRRQVGVEIMRTVFPVTSPEERRKDVESGYWLG